MTDLSAEPTPPPATPPTPTPTPKPKKKVLRNIAISVGAFVLLMVILVSVSIAADSTSSASDDEDTSASEPEKDAPAPSFAPEPEPEEPDMNLPFGDALTYTDMVSISVSKPAAYNPSEYSAGADQKHHIKINITITNGSDVNLDPSPYGQMSSGGVEGSEIYDDNMGGSPDTVILPGKTVTWSQAWSIADPADIVFQIAPSYDYEDAIYVLGQ